MNNKQDKELTDQLKSELKKAKTREELEGLVSSAGMELDDTLLDEVVGGSFVFGYQCEITD